MLVIQGAHCEATSSFFLFLLYVPFALLHRWSPPGVGIPPACVTVVTQQHGDASSDEVATRKVMRAVSLIVRSKNDHTDFFSRFHWDWRGSRDSNHSLSSLCTLSTPRLGDSFIIPVLEWRFEVDRMVFRFLTGQHRRLILRSNYECGRCCTTECPGAPVFCL